MHPSVFASDDIDYNLYPALLQVFAIVLLGYVAAHLRIINSSQALGINKFVGKFALPALLFRNIATLDFSVVNWYFLTSIFVSKSIVFFGVAICTLIAVRPINLGLAAVFAIFVSQSNDFALGFPIVNAIYSKTHPDYIHYIYLIAPISLCILNPIAFFMLEANEKIHEIKKLTSGNAAIKAKLNKSDLDYRDDDRPVRKSESENDAEKEIDFEDIELEDEDNDNDNDDDKKRLVSRIQASLSKKKALETPEAPGTSDQLRLNSSHGNDQASPNTSGSFESSFVNQQSTTNSLQSPNGNSTLSDSVGRPVSPSTKFSNTQILKATILSTIQNPIVLMTFIGIIANFILKQHIPALIKPVLDALADTFSALALFYLGFTMVGKIKNLRLSSILVILILIFTKTILFPLISREAVLHIQNSRELPANASKAEMEAFKNETEALSTFGFLYGTFPTAPSLFFYMAQYKSINSDLVSAALVFCTLASAPLMMVSGKMIALQFNNTQVNNFEDIECKTAYGFGLVTWLSCIWVVYIFLVSGRLLRRPHRFTFFLIIAQMLNALVHIVWTHLSPYPPRAENRGLDNNLPGYFHVIFGLFTSYLTRCWPLAIMFSVISIYCDLGIRRHQTLIHVSGRNTNGEAASSFHARLGNQMSSFFQLSRLNRFILVHMAHSRFIGIFVGLFLPIFTSALCIITSASIPPQGMMISLGKPQIIISIALLAFVSTVNIYLIFMLVRFRNSQKSQTEQCKRRRQVENQNQASSSSSRQGSPLRYGIDGITNLEVSSDLTAQTSGMKQDSEQQNLLDQSDDGENGAENDSDLRHLNRRRSKRKSSRGESARLTNSNDDVEKNSDELDSKLSLTQLNKQYQLMQHLALVVVLTFNSLMCMFFQMWTLFDENKSAIFYELELIDLTLLYGQGFFTFVIFGLDHKYILAPISFKIKEWFHIIEKFKLPQIEHVPAETLEVCKLFETKYKSECLRKFTRDQRFHHKVYQKVFTGSEMVDWLMQKRLVKTRNQGVEFGRKLVISRVIHHVSHNRHFYDNYSFYRFNES